MSKQNEIRIKKLECAVLCALVVTVALSVTGFGASCQNIRESVLRMHVIAHSDSKEDQAVKLKVRDAVLKAGESVFDGSVTAQNAEIRLKQETKRLEQAANQVLMENGMPYRAKVCIGKEYFNTRTYENEVTLPAGTYEAVRVILGEGKGKNWWCVMFPPMCLPAAEAKADIEDVLPEKEAAITRRNPKLEMRFKIVELFEKIAEQAK